MSYNQNKTHQFQPFFNKKNKQVLSSIKVNKLYKQVVQVYY